MSNKPEHTSEDLLAAYLYGRSFRGDRERDIFDRIARIDEMCSDLALRFAVLERRLCVLDGGGDEG